MKKLLKWILLSSIILTLVGCKISAPSRDMSNINRDTSRNTVVYEVFDDGNCGDGVCPPPEEYE